MNICLYQFPHRRLIAELEVRPTESVGNLWAIIEKHLADNELKMRYFFRWYVGKKDSTQLVELTDADSTKTILSVVREHGNTLHLEGPSIDNPQELLQALAQLTTINRQMKNMQLQLSQQLQSQMTMLPSMAGNVNPTPQVPQPQSASVPAPQNQFTRPVFQPQAAQATAGIPQTQNTFNTLWQALKSSDIDSCATVLSIVQRPDCGLERITSKDEARYIEMGAGATPLVLAVLAGRPDVAKAHIAAGAKVKATNDLGNSSLHVAAYFGDVEAITVLIKHGVDKNCLNKEEMTPAYLAAQKGHLAAVEALADNQANLDIAGKNGWTPLHMAIRCNHPHIIIALIAKGANPEAATKEGQTPMFLAVSLGNAAAIKVLASHGANIEARNNMGRTSLHVVQYSVDRRTRSMRF